MDKKIGLIIGIVAVMVVAIAAVAAVPQTNSSTANETTGNVTIGNETFHIPDGFKEINSTNSHNYASKEFQKGKDSITISVGPRDINSTILKQSGTVNRTISEIDGLYYKFSDDTHFFGYKSGENLILIVSSDDSLIEQVLQE